MSHTKEPWATNGRRIESAEEHGWTNDGWIIASLEGPDAEANATRIVACVNACAGMADPAAEIAALRAEVERMRKFADTVFAVMSSASSDLSEIDDAMAELEVAAIDAAPAPSAQSADAGDAARLQYLADTAQMQWGIREIGGYDIQFGVVESSRESCSVDDLRAAIDAARAEGGGDA